MSIAAPMSSSPAPPMRRFTVEEFHKMIEAGVFHEDDHIELLEGWIIQKMVHNPRHDATLSRTQDAIKKRVTDDWRVRVQCAIIMADSEPEPDIAVVAGPMDRFNSRHPGAADIELLVEVSDSSLSFDRTIKAGIYARAGIGQYWIVNVPSQTVEVYTLPATGPAAGEHAGYPTPSIYSINDSVSLKIGELRVSIPVFELFNG